MSAGVYNFKLVIIYFTIKCNNLSLKIIDDDGTYSANNMNKIINNPQAVYLNSGTFL